MCFWRTCCCCLGRYSNDAFLLKRQTKEDYVWYYSHVSQLINFVGRTFPQAKKQIFEEQTSCLRSSGYRSGYADKYSWTSEQGEGGESFYSWRGLSDFCFSSCFFDLQGSFPAPSLPVLLPLYAQPLRPEAGLHVGCLHCNFALSRADTWLPGRFSLVQGFLTLLVLVEPVSWKSLRGTISPLQK